jgi:hypothetical protein
VHGLKFLVPPQPPVVFKRRLPRFDDDTGGYKNKKGKIDEKENLRIRNKSLTR